MRSFMGNKDYKVFQPETIGNANHNEEMDESVNGCGHMNETVIMG